MLHTIMVVVLLIAAGYFAFMVLGIAKTAQKRGKLRNEHEHKQFMDGRR